MARKWLPPSENRRHGWQKITGKVRLPKDTVIQVISTHTPEKSEWFGFWNGEMFYGAISQTHPFPDMIEEKYITEYKIPTRKLRRKSLWDQLI